MKSAKNQFKLQECSSFNNSVGCFNRWKIFPVPDLQKSLRTTLQCTKKLWKLIQLCLKILVCFNLCSGRTLKWVESGFKTCTCGGFQSNLAKPVYHIYTKSVYVKQLPKCVNGGKGIKTFCVQFCSRQSICFCVDVGAKEIIIDWGMEMTLTSGHRRG